MDFRLYDNAVGRFWCMDALSEKYHYISPYHFGNNNPVFWSDPSGLSATSSEFTHDFMGRARFDKYGMFIPPFERQYKSITTDGGNGEGSGGGGSQLMSLLKALSNIAGTDVTWTNKNGSWHSDTGLILRPSGNGWILWEPFSSVEELTDSGSELGGVISGMRKIFISIDAGGSGNGNKVAEIALSYKGDLRKYSLSDIPGTIDCSRLTREIASKAGYSIPRTAFEQAQWFKKNGYWSSQLSDTKLGDHIFWLRGKNAYHTGIVVDISDAGGVSVIQAQVNGYNPGSIKIHLLMPSGQIRGFGQPFVGVGRVN